VLDATEDGTAERTGAVGKRFPARSQRSQNAEIVVLGNYVAAGIVVEHMLSEIRSDRQNSSKLTGDERRHGNAAWRYRSGSDTEHKARG